MGVRKKIRKALKASGARFSYPVDAQMLEDELVSAIKGTGPVEKTKQIPMTSLAGQSLLGIVTVRMDGKDLRGDFVLREGDGAEAFFDLWDLMEFSFYFKQVNNPAWRRDGEAS